MRRKIRPIKHKKGALSLNRPTSNLNNSQKSQLSTQNSFFQSLYLSKYGQQTRSPHMSNLSYLTRNTFLQRVQRNLNVHQ